MKMYQVLEFQKLYTELKDRSMPFKTVRKFSKLFSRLEEEVTFYQENFKKLVDEYSEKDEEGNPVLLDNGQGVKIKEDLITECNMKVDELNNLDVEITDIKFNEEEFENLNLTIGEASFLIPFIEE